MGAFLSLRARVIHLANEETLAAQRVLRPARDASNGDIVGLSQEFFLKDLTDIPRLGTTSLWSLHDGRFMPTRVVQIDPAIRAQAALAHALLAEDQTIQALPLHAVRGWPKTDDPYCLIALFVPGGAIVYQRRQDLSLGKRIGNEAQMHLRHSQYVFMSETLSNHARVNALACLSDAASDIATWGTFERHLGEADEASPKPRKVSVSL